MPIPVVVSSAALALTSPVRALTIGDIAMSAGSGVLDDYGVTWLLEKVSGWTGTPAPTGDSTQRAGDHGVFTSPAFLPGRVIAVEGSFRADWATSNAAIGRLAAAVPISDLDTLTVYAADSGLQAMVRQEGELLIDQNVATTSFSFSLLAPDPRRYSVDTTTVSTHLPTTTGGLSLPVTLPLTIGATVASGVLSVTNDGNMATRPTLTVTGPCPAFSITHRQSGRTLRFADSIAAGRSLVIDTDRKRALLDGTAARVVTGSWFEYAPGVNDVSFSAATYDSGALLTSTHRSAWR